MDKRFAPVFLSHGSPMTALEPGAAGAAWRAIGTAIADAPPAAIVAFSPHTPARVPTTLAAARHEAVHDFGGFPAALYELRYDVPGAPCMAPYVEQLLEWAALPFGHADAGGLDHGLWVPLRMIRPQADVPVLPVAFPPDWSPAQLMELGAALRPLVDEGVWIVATGSITHNLRLGLPRADRPLPERPDAAAFRAWFAERSAARDRDALLDWRRRAPHAFAMHPTDEHLLPWFIAAGAGGLDDAPRRLHEGVEGGHLGMDAYAFGPEAAALASAVEAAPATA
jgi:4,5-DOPA dioxygenase extradiol